MDPFVAEIRIFPFNFAPKGWAFCDGQILPLSQNTALFSLLGTTYGGDGKSNFALPNMQGNTHDAPRPGAGPPLHDLGETGGSDTVLCSNRRYRRTTTPWASITRTLRLRMRRLLNLSLARRAVASPTSQTLRIFRLSLQTRRWRRAGTSPTTTCSLI